MRPWLLILILTLSTCPLLAQAMPGWPGETRDSDTGLRVWDFPSAEEGSFHLLVLVGVGSRDEDRTEAGISHFLEHCLFLSTQTRSEKELIQGLRRRGGQSNGQTTEDWTAYWVSVPVRDWRYAVDWLTEQLAQPGFAPKEVDRERGIVIEEIQTRHAHGKAPTFEALLYGDHPLGRSIAGSESSVGSVDLPKLQAWYQRHYKLDNLVVAFSGQVPSQECTTRIQTQLAGMSQGSGTRTLQALHPRFGRSRMQTGMRPASDRRGFVITGYLIEPTGPQDLATLLVAKTLLDDAIFDEIRSKRGLAYAPAARLVIRDAIWRFDCRIDVGERNNLPSVLEGTELAFADLSSVSAENYKRARLSVLGSLSVSSAQSLLRCTELTWALLGPDRAPDLRRTVAELDPNAFAARVKALLPPERQFVISDSIDLIRPSYRLFWIFIASLGAAAALIWWLPRHIRRLRQSRPRQRVRQEPVSQGVAMPKSSDIDEVEREFENWFREEDERKQD